jgi:uncharacterized protein
MPSFDDIEIRRPAIAASYLALLAAQPGRPLALFAPRRVGKTRFLDHDLAPAARAAGLLPVYADLWLHKSAPLEAVNHALEEALDDLQAPASRIGKIAQTPVQRVTVLGSSVDLGPAPARRPLPDAPALRLDALVTRLAREHKGAVLLMLDEVQTLGEVANGSDLLGSLRAVLHKRRKEVSAVFTGSSQEGLARLMNTAGAPMYQFAQMLDFPALDDRFLRLLAGHYRKVHPTRKLELAPLREGFQRIGFKPGLMRDIVKAMSAEGITDVGQGITHYMRSDQQTALWRALLGSVDVFDQAVLTTIARGQAPMSQATLQALAAIPGARPTIAKVRASIEKLKRQGLLTRGASGSSIDDPLFAEFLAARGAAPRASQALPAASPGGPQDTM